MSQQWERSPVGDSFSSRPTRTPEQEDEALLATVLRHRPDLTREEAQQMIDLLD
jgi:hypothetical protein